MNLPSLYQNAKQSIAEYKSVDELKQFRDKVVAIETYAKQANDFDLERDASICRVRAERRCGELLKQTPLNKGAATPSNETRTSKTLKEMGITYDQSSNWQKLADVSEQTFEEIVNNRGLPISGGQILATTRPVESKQGKIDTNVLWLWGRLRDMENDKIFDQPLSEYIESMTDGMKPDALRIIPKLKQWLKDYE